MKVKLSSFKQTAALSLLLAGSLSFGAMVGAFGETTPEGVQIKEFSLLDTGADVVGSVDFTPEGKKDGHFKLQLNLAKKTVINSVVLRSTDDYGKDNSKGVWRTNRVTTGWLLGIVQDKTIITSTGTTHETVIVNPGFRKDVREPVGEFEGELTFNLYASDNGTIKETQYYVLEIETPQGTVASKPIKYKKPMTTGGTSPTPTAPSPSPSPIPSPTPSPAPAEGPMIRVFFKGQELTFSEVSPVIKDGSTLVPFRKLFETLGFKVKWIDSGDSQQAIGTKNGLTIELTINSTIAKVNGTEVSMEVPTQIVNGNTLVPLRFVAESTGYKVTYARNGSITTIQIDEPNIVSNPVPTPSPATPSDPVKEEVEPYVVKGYVRNASGQPIPEVSVFADNTFMYDSNILGVTDETGHYLIELPQMSTTYHMGAHVKKQFNGKTYMFQLEADGDLPVSGSKGAVRNFTWSNFNGQMYVYPNFKNFDDTLPEFNMNDLELTLTPTGPLLDGSPGQTIIKRGGPIAGGAGIDNIPIGRYKATARWVPEGHAPMPMLIRINYTGQFAESTEFEFGPSDGVSSTYMSELEVSL
ncbi:copper amine oxidase N-terminal domain-containing protein [Paenibacillus sp. 2RAB27]|uniref:copper amine oxidase N-terminal domain-containing protein n=1 Tax=Paenibacillus sp. 2RAB27 TaxID=3232991 RepID=UPI003F9AE8A9